MDFPVIDAHIHPFIEPENNIAAFGDPTTLDGFIREMRRTGVSRACGSVIARRAASFEDVQKLNREALKIRDAYPDFYIPGIHIHGGHPEESCRELELMYKEYGVRWIGELVAYMMQTGEYDSGGMFRIYETARDLGMPVNIHCSDLEVIERILKNFPTLNLVIAHPEDVGNAKNVSSLSAGIRTHISIFREPGFSAGTCCGMQLTSAARKSCFSAAISRYAAPA